MLWFIPQFLTAMATALAAITSPIYINVSMVGDKIQVEEARRVEMVGKELGRIEPFTATSDKRAFFQPPKCQYEGLVTSFDRTWSLTEKSKDPGQEDKVLLPEPGVMAGKAYVVLREKCEGDVAWKDVLYVGDTNLRIVINRHVTYKLSEIPDNLRPQWLETVIPRFNKYLEDSSDARRLEIPAYVKTEISKRPE
jgi:hypothetical protein